VLDVLYGPDETTIISATNDGSITEWNLETGEKVRQFVGHDGPVWSLDLGPGNRSMASGSSDGSVMLWDYITGEMLHRFEGHMGGFSMSSSAQTVSECIQPLLMGQCVNGV